MLYRLVRPFLFQLDPERVHRDTMRLLDVACRFRLSGAIAGAMVHFPRRVMGLEFPNPVGLAAGLDKNGEHIDSLAAMGFGFIEVGTVTPRPQAGNPAPRLFRIPEARAIVNRMGFNNDGVERLVDNVGRARYRGILGINIGMNSDTPIERAAEDYLYCLRKAHAAASYVAVNISSPNTAQLRQLQQPDRLDQLLGTLTEENQRLAARHGRTVRLAVKIAPDLNAEEIGRMAASFLSNGVDAVIATNTTVSRDGVEGLANSEQAGGLSGAPLRVRATAVLRELARSLAGRIPIIGVGGVFSAADAREKVDAGASLIQLYSGLIYEGPGLVRRIAADLAARA
ncbi:MAG: quinone-dependent dihydroorotate dehydrogenase [Betaproteobacteria bacterium]